MKKDKNPILLKDLTTPFEHHEEHAWDIYPRPQMKRESYIPLNGAWQLSVTKEGNLSEKSLGTIEAPYTPESKCGGVRAIGSQSFGPIVTSEHPQGRSLLPDEKWIYEKKTEAPALKDDEYLILHFGAVDQVASVYVNDVFVGEHRGGYLPFSFNITAVIHEGLNTIRVEVKDPLDPDLPYGKQRKNRGGMWYTPFSGIWQTVFMEVVPKTAFQAIKITPSLDSVTIQVKGGKIKKTLTIQAPTIGDLPEEVLAADTIIEFEGTSVTVQVEDPKLWTPDNPYLYHFSLTDGSDTIASYFALRTFEAKDGKFLLNGKPVFLHGLLDQGFYSDGICLPASPEGYTFDIETMKKLGFNLLRKHIKIEPEFFYYECDRLGMLVMQDLVNSGVYDFFVDTILPTVGMNAVRKKAPSDVRRAQFEKDAELTLKHLYNHPCVIGYTIFNEGWGEYEADRLYLELKEQDPTRFYDAASGWFNEKNSDVISRHVYFRKLKMAQFKPRKEAYSGKPEITTRPLLLSEFGGYACFVPEHIMNPEKEYGYRKIESKEALSKAMEKLYLEEVVPLIEGGLAGCILTQASDVEDEINGLVTYDRQVVKVDEAVMQKIALTLKAAFAASNR